ncbi:hypothetical protein K438DRAFT_1763043 [Mycena galopus ATCC 62051]|nr:hypothetical protein K438DRAFT_1763043 [Mycena galopus ATCC 62051]
MSEHLAPKRIAKAHGVFIKAERKRENEKNYCGGVPFNESRTPGPFGYNLGDEQTLNSCRQKAQLGATVDERLIDELGASDFEVRPMSRPEDFENTTQLLGVIIRLGHPRIDEYTSRERASRFARSGREQGGAGKRGPASIT